MQEVSFFKERVYPILFMVFLTVVFISAISGIYLQTASLVEENETIFLKKAVLFSVGIQVPESNNQINRVYSEHVKEYMVDGKPGVFEIDGGKGYAFRVTGPGLWGEIEALIGFDADLKTMTGIDFIKQNETPGLGARIEEEWFKTQFRQKSPPFSLVREDAENTGPNEVNAITGATYTSNYVRDMVNDSPEEAAALLKEVR
ncbi:FMN-binding protein [Marispirochaeta aestuarii]|uniref:FMN-binding protein n=1 Tax=Marispirochaeta aestuarii TaxID=1963862 RepID=UPI0029C93F8D|nr:FMN-binding protein [Marispirochaeta aestuarii]